MVLGFYRSGLYFQTIYDTLWKQKRIRYEMNFKEEIPLGEFPLFCSEEGNQALSYICVANVRRNNLRSRL